MSFDHRLRQPAAPARRALGASTAAVLSALALAAGAPAPALAAPATRSVAGARARASAKRRAVLCQHRHGHTILRQGAVRVFRVTVEKGPGPEGGEGVVYGCVRGSSRVVALWDFGYEDYGSVQRVAGRFAAVEAGVSSQYAGGYWLTVYDLRSGASYKIFEVAPQPLGAEPPSKEEAIRAYVLAPDGDTAMLYEDLAVGHGGEPVTPTGMTLELFGFHHFSQVLATTAPGTIPPSSLGFNGQTVTWTQSGEPRSASV